MLLGMTGSEGGRAGAGSAGAHGDPHVGGVVIDTGETLAADLVVDAMGRNTSLDRMLDAIGARRPDDQEEDHGFVYYCRHFRNDEPRSVPVADQPRAYEGTSLLTIPGDGGTYSLTFYVASNDHELRGLRDASADIDTAA